MEKVKKSKGVSPSIPNRNFLNRENRFVEGFNFSTDDFEDLIEFFTPLEDIYAILGVSYKELDEFCRLAYGSNASKVYNDYLSLAFYFNRKAFVKLSRSGSATAMNIVASNFMHLNNNSNNNELAVSVSFDLPSNSNIQKGLNVGEIADDDDDIIANNGKE